MLFFMKMDVENLRELVEKNLRDSSLFVVAIKTSDSGDSRKVKVILDGDHGITIDQCAEISRRLSDELDSDDSASKPFVLEVTSPGVDHPLQMFRQYVKNVGRKVKVVLKDKTERKGTLKNVNDKFIEVESEIKSKKKKESLKELVEIPFDKIDKTNIQISFK